MGKVEHRATFPALRVGLLLAHSAALQDLRALPLAPVQVEAAVQATLQRQARVALGAFRVVAVAVAVLPRTLWAVHLALAAQALVAKSG